MPRLYFLTTGKRRGFCWRKDFQSATALIRAAVKPGHSPVAMCRRVPGWSEQPGTLQWPVGSPDQCLLNQQVRYLPLSILAWTVAFLTSNGELPAEVQRVCGWQRDMYSALNIERESQGPAQQLLTWCSSSSKPSALWCSCRNCVMDGWRE